MREFDIKYPHSKVKRVLKEGSRSIKNKIIAWGLGEEYYDGQRENGYGGFRYDGRWATIMPVFLNTSSHSSTCRRVVPSKVQSRNNSFSSLVL